MSVPPEVQTEIIRRLDACEAEHGVKIVYCAESGSRAWGFASPDSDYDVRFLYVRPGDWYLSFDVEKRRDVIEYPIVDEIDINGWDLKKALYLFTRTNGALLEWLGSPIVYREIGDTAARLRTLAGSQVSDIALCYHYSHMARRNAQQFLDKETVKLKKYFYVLRPLLAIRWIQSGKGIPPVPFEELLEAEAPREVVREVRALLELKRKTPELGTGPQNATINEFVLAEFDRHGETFSGQGRPEEDRAQRRDELNSVFRDAIQVPTPQA